MPPLAAKPGPRPAQRSRSLLRHLPSLAFPDLATERAFHSYSATHRPISDLTTILLVALLIIPLVAPRTADYYACRAATPHAPSATPSPLPSTLSIPPVIQQLLSTFPCQASWATQVCWWAGNPQAFFWIFFWDNALEFGWGVACLTLLLLLKVTGHRSYHKLRTPMMVAMRGGEFVLSVIAVMLKAPHQPSFADVHFCSPTLWGATVLLWNCLMLSVPFDLQLWVIPVEWGCLVVCILARNPDLLAPAALLPILFTQAALGVLIPTALLYIIEGFQRRQFLLLQQRDQQQHAASQGAKGSQQQKQPAPSGKGDKEHDQPALAAAPDPRLSASTTEHPGQAVLSDSVLQLHSAQLPPTAQGSGVGMAPVAAAAAATVAAIAAAAVQGTVAAAAAVPGTDAAAAAAPGAAAAAAAVAAVAAAPEASGQAASAAFPGFARLADKPTLSVQQLLSLLQLQVDSMTRKQAAAPADAQPVPRASQLQFPHQATDLAPLRPEDAAGGGSAHQLAASRGRLSAIGSRLQRLEYKPVTSRLMVTAKILSPPAHLEACPDPLVHAVRCTLHASAGPTLLTTQHAVIRGCIQLLFWVSSWQAPAVPVITDATAADPATGPTAGGINAAVLAVPPAVMQAQLLAAVKSTCADSSAASTEAPGDAADDGAPPQPPTVSASVQGPQAGALFWIKGGGVCCLEGQLELELGFLAGGWRGTYGASGIEGGIGSGVGFECSSGDVQGVLQDMLGPDRMRGELRAVILEIDSGSVVLDVVASVEMETQDVDALVGTTRVPLHGAQLPSTATPLQLLLLPANDTQGTVLWSCPLLAGMPPAIAIELHSLYPSMLAALSDAAGSSQPGAPIAAAVPKALQATVPSAALEAQVFGEQYLPFITELCLAAWLPPDEATATGLLPAADTAATADLQPGSSFGTSSATDAMQLDHADQPAADAAEELQQWQQQQQQQQQLALVLHVAGYLQQNSLTRTLTWLLQHAVARLSPLSPASSHTPSCSSPTSTHNAAAASDTEQPPEDLSAAATGAAALRVAPVQGLPPAAFGSSCAPGTPLAPPSPPPAVPGTEEPMQCAAAGPAKAPPAPVIPFLPADPPTYHPTTPKHPPPGLLILPPSPNPAPAAPATPSAHPPPKFSPASPPSSKWPPAPPTPLLAHAIAKAVLFGTFPDPCMELQYRQYHLVQTAVLDRQGGALQLLIHLAQATRATSHLEACLVWAMVIGQLALYPFLAVRCWRQVLPRQWVMLALQLLALMPPAVYYLLREPFPKAYCQIWRDSAWLAVLHAMMAAALFYQTGLWQTTLWTGLYATIMDLLLEFPSVAARLTTLGCILVAPPAAAAAMEFVRRNRFMCRRSTHCA